MIFRSCANTSLLTKIEHRRASSNSEQPAAGKNARLGDALL
jgi:hypothetical protein